MGSRRWGLLAMADPPARSPADQRVLDNAQADYRERLNVARRRAGQPVVCLGCGKEVGTFGFCGGGCDVRILRDRGFAL